MKIRLTFEFTKNERLALSHQMGDKKPANRNRLENWVRASIYGDMSEVVHDYENNKLDDPICPECEHHASDHKPQEDGGTCGAPLNGSKRCDCRSRLVLKR